MFIFLFQLRVADCILTPIKNENRDRSTQNHRPGQMASSSNASIRGNEVTNVLTMPDEYNFHAFYRCQKCGSTYKRMNAKKGQKHPCKEPSCGIVNAPYHEVSCLQPINFSY